MVGARTLAMALNRAHRRRDRRPQPAHGSARAPGRHADARAGVGALRGGARRSTSWPSSQLDPVVRWLWPIPVAFFVVYPYLKRFTWLCHLWLGACLGLAPVGAWLAVTGTAPWEAWALGAAGRALGGGLRPLLLAVRPRARSRRGPALVGDALRRARCLQRARARSTRRPSCCSRPAGWGLGVGVWYWLGVAAVAALLALRAPARASRRPPSARRGVLHGQRRDQRRLLRVRRARRPHVAGFTAAAVTGVPGTRRTSGADPAHTRMKIARYRAAGIPGIPWGHVERRGKMCDGRPAVERAGDETGRA